MLIRCRQGEAGVWRTVRAPTVEEKDDRQLHREWESLHHEQSVEAHRARMATAAVKQFYRLRGQTVESALADIERPFA
jgi:hypothetical protein